MFYDASWRLIEEHICDDWDLSLGGDVNRIGQYFWGLRYIDDFIYRQEDRDLTNADPGDDPEPDFIVAETGAWFALTDVQFSVVALMTPEARIAERVVYDPYGRGRHYFPSDYNGDTLVNVPDLNSHFLSAWFADNLSADWTRDNDTDVPDIFSYQSDWFAHDGDDAGAGQISFRYVPGTSAGPDNQIGYCGYVFNPETDDYTVRFRHYDPEIGRWLERDPLPYVDGSSLYLYASAWPTYAADATGLAATEPEKNGNFWYCYDTHGPAIEVYDRETDTVYLEIKIIRTFWFPGSQPQVVGKKRIPKPDLDRSAIQQPDKNECSCIDASIEKSLADEAMIRTTGNEMSGEVRGTVVTGGVLLFGKLRAAKKCVRVAKAANLPGWKKLDVDWEHIFNRHMHGGKDVQKGSKKDLFPDNWTKDQVCKAVRDAYEHCEKIETQGTRVRVRGKTKDGKQIEMWVNTEDCKVETAYPLAEAK